MMNIEQKTLVLSDKRWIDNSESPLFYGLAILAIIILPIVIAIILARIMIFPDTPWEQLLSKLVEKLSSIDWSKGLGSFLQVILFLTVGIGQVVYMKRASKLERLTLTPDGIQYTSPLPTLLKRLKPDWSLAWNQIQKAELGTFNGKLISSELVLLTINTASEKRRIFPSRWVNSTEIFQ